MAIEVVSVNFKMSTSSLMLNTVLLRFFAVAAAMNNLRCAMKLNEFASRTQSYRCLLTMNIIIAHETQLE